MKIVILPGHCTPFHRGSLEERPLGGTETGVICLSNALAELGHEVTVVSDIPDKTDLNPKYIVPEQIASLRPQDICIGVRSWIACFTVKNCKKYFFWTGDSFDNAHTYGIGDPRFYKFIDGLFCVGSWQAEGLCLFSGFPSWKVWVLRNGVRLSNFSGEEQRQRKRLIYTSQPSRGLAYLPRIFRELKTKHPELELHIFSSGKLYEPVWIKSAVHHDYDQLFSLLKSMEGCYVHGNILQKDLAREYMKSAIWAYPTHFEETSCISAMEAQAGGCAIVTSALAGLIETVGEAGILLQEKAGSPEYMQKFIEATDRVLSDDSLFLELSRKSLERAKKFDWKMRAESLLEYLKTSHGL